MKLPNKTCQRAKGKSTKDILKGNNIPMQCNIIQKITCL